MNCAYSHNIALFLSGEKSMDESLLQYVHDGFFTEDNSFHLVHVVNEESKLHIPMDIDRGDDKVVSKYFEEFFSDFSRKFSKESDIN